VRRFDVIRQVIFKLKHDIANDSELPLASLELAAVLGLEAAPIRNLADLLVAVDWLQASVAEGASNRIQDVFLRMPYPGAIQGYQTSSLPPAFSISQIAVLTYFRDVFVVFSGSPLELLAKLGLPAEGTEPPASKFLAPTGYRVSPTASVHQLSPGKRRFVLRIIANHCFLECTDHAVRLAQRPKDVDRMYDGMLRHLQDNYSRPFAASVQMGYKWIEDFIDDRRPPNAYATHSLFGLRGRFFPRMVRALSNYLIAKTGAKVVVDPFAGVGTLGIECSLLGVPSRSYDLNPFFVEVSRAKHHALCLSARDVAELEELRECCQELLRAGTDNGQGSLFEGRAVPVSITIPRSLSRVVKEDSVRLVERLRGQIDLICSPPAARVARLALAYYANSILKKYTREKTLRCFWAHLSRTIYLHIFLKRLYADGILAVPALASFEQGNVKTLSQRESGVAAVVTSPPYTTAIDYVGNDVMAYYAVGLQGHEEVEAEMIGSTRLGRILAPEAEGWNAHVPAAVRNAHRHVHEGNPKKAVCLAKYFRDMAVAMQEITRALAPGGRMALVVCGTQEFGAGKARVRYNVAEAIAEIAAGVGLGVERQIDVDLTKNGDGDIMQESVLLLGK
jgi:hypothetical protein